ncbi:MAG: formylglycine-generating enzyme family protein [Rhodospirillaceae bacterium]|nr:formylglycine-generating enzyme family protein [Rhodospirillaceae bacterium]
MRQGCGQAARAACAIALCLLALLAPLAGPSHAQSGDIRTLKDCPTCPELAVIPAGRFAMGSPPGSPEMDLVGRGRAESGLMTIVIERAFALGKVEVTRAEYAVFVQAAAYAPDIPFCRIWDKANQRFSDVPGRTWRDNGLTTPATDAHPVTCVSWDDAVAYARWLSAQTGKRYRLPSEAEWEYAARAGSTGRRPWGEDNSLSCAYANTYDITSLKAYPLAWQHTACVDGFADLAPVGSLFPNAWGLHDMIGNVWEWATDCFTTSKIGRPKNQEPWLWPNCSDRVLRGGSWMTAPDRARVAFPAGDPPSDRYSFLGFRIARDLDPGEAP